MVSSQAAFRFLGQIMKSLLRIPIFTFTILFGGVAFGQEPVVPPIAAAPVVAKHESAPTHFSVLFGYAGNEFKPNIAEAAEYANGIWIEANGRILAPVKFRLVGTVNCKLTFDQTLDADYVVLYGPLPPFGFTRIAIKRDVDTLSVGPKISYGVAGPVRVYGAALFGFRDFKFDPNTGDGDNKQFSRRYQFGADLELGHFVVRPFYYEKEFTGGLLVKSADSYGAGVGFRF